MKKWYFITGVLALLWLISLGTCLGNSAEVGRLKGELAEGVPEEPTPMSPSGSMLIVPDEVIAEFEDNPIAARAKYVGKLVELRGRIDSITTFLGPMLIMGELDGPPYWQANCSFESEEELVLLHRGDGVTVVGVFSSCDPTASVIWLDDCHIR